MRRTIFLCGNLLCIGLIFLACVSSLLAQTQQAPGRVYGTVEDPSGAAVAGAHVTLTRPNSTENRESQTSETGEFSFEDIAPGPYQLKIAALRFTTQTVSGTLPPGQVNVVPPVTLEVATVVSTVKVTPSTYELAEVQLKQEEQQRVLGFIPNFYVSYIPDAPPFSSGQKFRLALKTMVDPVNVALVAAGAGLEQATNQLGGYGQGADGYGKRFGASYADFVTSTFLGSALLPSLLKQDPRYFYKGTGTTKSRAFYAIANAVICKSDKGRWQPNYSEFIGTLASAGISNAYYPANDRGAGITFETAAISIAEGAAANLLQEFVAKKITPNLPNRNQNNP